MMKVFDKEFDVEFLDFDDRSTHNNVSRMVRFKVGGETYRYGYSGGATMALSSVVKVDPVTGENKEVYSSWKQIEDGAYYQEIGRILSTNQQKDHERT